MENVSYKAEASQNSLGETTQDNKDTRMKAGIPVIVASMRGGHRCLAADKSKCVYSKFAGLPQVPPAPIKVEILSKVPAVDVTQSGGAMKNEFSSQVPAEDVTQSGGAMKNEFSSQVSAEDVTQSGGAMKNEFSSQVPAEDVTQSGGAMKNEFSSQVPAENVTQSGGAMKNKFSSQVPAEDVTQFGGAMKNKFSSQVPAEDVTQFGGAMKNEFSSRVPAEDVTQFGGAMRNTLASQVPAVDATRFEDIGPANSTCYVCNKTFSDTFLRDRHMREVCLSPNHPEDIIRCPACGQIFKKKKYLRYHVVLKRCRVLFPVDF
ncbi:uncharacterized protein [Palaemon carinicauda]|uniref:uncharacterized protein n=1 Tax=Palaemon carinicauda TaxID=392227 RepID=UPI0035B681E6